MMDRNTGKTIAGEARLIQKIYDVLTTPLGSRVMRRNYGSRLFELIDAPLNSATSLLMSAATAGALAKWVPEILLSRVTYSLNPDNTGLIANIRSQRLDVPDTPLNLALPIPFK